jgi:hypothetical protein
VIGTDDNEQAKLVEKWLFEEGKKSVSLNENEDSGNLGILSEKYESGNRGVGTISTGVGDYGGVSYGLYQFATNNSSIDSYINSPEFSKWRNVFENLKPATKEFNKEWKKIAKEEPELFRKSQHDYIYRTHYLFFKEKNKNLLDLDNYSIVLKDVCWSTAVHHGKSTGVLKKALEGKNISNMSEKEIIEAIYEERGRTNKSGNLVYFISSSKKVQKNIKTRFENELLDALNKLK